MDLNIHTSERPMLLREWALGPGSSFSGGGSEDALSLSLLQTSFVDPAQCG